MHLLSILVFFGRPPHWVYLLCRQKGRIPFPWRDSRLKHGANSGRKQRSFFGLKSNFGRPPPVSIQGRPPQLNHLYSIKLPFCQQPYLLNAKYRSLRRELICVGLTGECPSDSTPPYPH